MCSRKKLIKQAPVITQTLKTLLCFQLSLVSSDSFSGVSLATEPIWSFAPSGPPAPSLALSIPFLSRITFLQVLKLSHVKYAPCHDSFLLKSSQW